MKLDKVMTRQILLLILTVAQTLSAVVIPPVASGPAERVTLGVGKQISLEGGSFRLGFDSVTSDSRCPIGYQCITAGEAKVRIWVEEGIEERQWKILSGPARTPYEVSHRHALQMISLEPNPVA